VSRLLTIVEKLCGQHVRNEGRILLVSPESMITLVSVNEEIVGLPHEVRLSLEKLNLRNQGLNKLYSTYL